MASARFAFPPGVELRVRGDGAALRHFRAEYGPRAVADGDAVPAVEVALGAELPRGRATLRDGHKTVRWEVALGDPGAAPLRAAITLHGRPRRFALSLVQGYIVEPLVALAAARGGCVLLPAAALAEGDGALVLLGASGTGKSSLCARALAAGRCVLGDDQVLVDRDARCHRFDRRMRVYSDLRQTAPAAWARLPRGARAALRARHAARVCSRGLVAPSLPLPASAIGPPGGAGPLTASRFVVLERAASAGRLERRALAPAEARGLATALLAAQRARLARGLDERWRAALVELAAAEGALLDDALARAPIERIALPGAWSAARAIGALEAELGLEPRA